MAGSYIADRPEKPALVEADAILIGDSTVTGEGSGKKHLPKQSATASSVALRTTGGQLKAADGVEDDDLVTVQQEAAESAKVVRLSRALAKNPDAGDTANIFADFKAQGFGLGSTDGIDEAKADLELFDQFSRTSAGWRFNSRGELEEVPAGQVRYNYNPATGEAEGILIEDQRTRLNTIAAAPTAPETVTVTAAAHTISFYGTGTLELTGANAQTIVGEGAFPTRTVVTFTPTAGGLTITPSGDVQHLQLELGSYATSPILGEGQQVTRTADIVARTLGAEFNPNEGTFVVEFEPATISQSQRVISLTDGTLSNNFNFYIIVTSASLAVSCASGGTTTIGATIIEPASALAKTKVAFSLTATSAKVSVNGGALTNAVGAVPMAAFTRLDLANRLNSQFFNGTISQLLYEPRAVSDIRLQELSTL